MRDCSWVPNVFENIQPQDFICSSDSTVYEVVKYNCIAWAAGKKDNFWWPRPERGYYWPPGLPREQLGQETLGNFINAFETEGFEVCGNGRFKNGFEKVAIYVDGNGHPTHAARLLSSGLWSSKLGDDEDIEHFKLNSLEGRAYGTVAVFLKRPNPLCQRPNQVKIFLSRLLGFLRTP
jgi:hypothetical protein